MEEDPAKRRRGQEAAVKAQGAEHLVCLEPRGVKEGCVQVGTRQEHSTRVTMTPVVQTYPLRTLTLAPLFIPSLGLLANTLILQALECSMPVEGHWGPALGSSLS